MIVFEVSLREPHIVEQNYAFMYVCMYIVCTFVLKNRYYVIVPEVCMQYISLNPEG